MSVSLFLCWLSFNHMIFLQSPWIRLGSPQILGKPSMIDGARFFCGSDTVADVQPRVSNHWRYTEC